MKTTVFALTLVVCLAPLCVFAIEVPLPELVGEYPAANPVMVSVDFGQPITDVSQVHFEIEGTLSPSWYTSAGDTLVWHGAFDAYFIYEGPGWWLAGMETGGVWGGEFYSISPFWGSYQADQNFLLDGQADLSVQFAGAGFPDVDEVGPYPSATITSAALIYNAPVEFESETWGSIKALFGR